VLGIRAVAKTLPTPVLNKTYDSYNQTLIPRSDKNTEHFDDFNLFPDIWFYKATNFNNQ
jgi:hypothetical protein